MLFRSSTRHLRFVVLLGTVWFLVGCVGERGELEKLKRTPNIPRLEAFLASCEAPEICREAALLMDDLQYERACRGDSLLRLNDYLEAYPGGTHGKEALERLRALLAEKLEQDGSEEAIRLARARFPGDKELLALADKGEQRILFNRLMENRQEEALEAYLKDQPDGAYRQEVEAALEGLLRERSERSDELDDWYAYVKRFPKGEGAARAVERMEDLAYKGCYGGDPGACSRFFLVVRDPARARQAASKLGMEVLPAILNGSESLVEESLFGGKPKSLPFEPGAVAEVLVKPATRIISGDEGFFFLLVVMNDASFFVYLPFASVRLVDGRWLLDTHGLSQAENWLHLAADEAMKVAIERVAEKDRELNKGPSYLVEYLAPRKCAVLVNELSSESLEVRATVLIALARSHCPEAIETLNRVLTTGNLPTERATAALAMGEMAEDQEGLGGHVCRMLLAAHDQEADEMVQLVELQTASRVSPAEASEYVTDSVFKNEDDASKLMTLSRHYLFASQFHGAFFAAHQAVETWTGQAAEAMDSGNSQLSGELQQQAALALESRNEAVRKAYEAVKDEKDKDVRLRAIRDVGRMHLLVPFEGALKAEMKRLLEELQVGSNNVEVQKAAGMSLYQLSQEPAAPKTPPVVEEEVPAP